MCALLLVTEEEWVHRRVETIDLLSAELVRRSSSVDLTVPEHLRPMLKIDDGQWLVPIATLSKGRLRNFDLRDEAGRAVPVVGRDHNGEIAYQALAGVAEFTSAAAGAGAPTERTQADLRSVATSKPADALHTLECMRRAAQNGDVQLQALLEDDWVLFLLLQLANNYILQAVIDGVDRRRVFKFGYDEPLDDDRPLRQRAGESLGTTPLVFNIAVPAAGRTASYHAELVIPEELRIDVAVLYDEETLTTHAIDEDADRGAIHATGIKYDDRTALYVFLRAQREGLPTAALAVSALTAALLSVGAWLVDLPVGSKAQAGSPGPAISVLLAAQALFVGMIAQRGEHLLVRRRFAFSRTLLVLAAVMALAASAVLAFNQSAAAVDRVWKAAAVVTIATTAILGYGWIRAVSSDPRRRKRGGS